MAAAAALLLTVLLALVSSGSPVGAAFAADPADLKITKSDSPDPVREGSVLTYTIVAQNLGPDAATNVTVTDKIPGGVDFVSVSTTLGTCVRHGQNVTCNVGTLGSAPYNESATITLRVRPNRTGSISNKATVDSNVADPQAANNSDTETTTVVAAPSPPAPPNCLGRPATIVGTAGADALVGTAGADVIVARAGNDVVNSRGGSDRVCANRGNDVVRSGARADQVNGGPGGDRLIGAAGADVLRGSFGRDVLFGGLGPDRLNGGPNFDRCFGGAGADVEFACEV